jgi:hypothetical protein
MRVSGERRVGVRSRGPGLLMLMTLLPGCLPLLAPHGEVRGNIGFAAGTTRAGTSDAVRLAGNVDAVYLPTQLLGCRREFDLGVGARFHFVEPDAFGVHPERVGGVASGTWLFFREPNVRGELRFDVDVLALENRPLAGLSVALGIEVIGFAEGSGAWGGWEGLFAGAWSGEVGLRVEAMAGYHEDFGGVRYATFTLGLAGRWPAGAGAAVVNPIYLGIAAFNAGTPSSASSGTATSTTSTTSTPTSTSTSGFGHSEGDVRGCPDLLDDEAVGRETSGSELAVDPANRYRCALVDETVAYVGAGSASAAEELCAERFGMPCVCALSR